MFDDKHNQSVVLRMGITCECWNTCQYETLPTNEAEPSVPIDYSYDEVMKVLRSDDFRLTFFSRI